MSGQGTMKCFELTPRRPLATNLEVWRAASCNRTRSFYSDRKELGSEPTRAGKILFPRFLDAGETLIEDDVIGVAHRLVADALIYAVRTRV